MKTIAEYDRNGAAVAGRSHRNYASVVAAFLPDYKVPGLSTDRKLNLFIFILEFSMIPHTCRKFRKKNSNKRLQSMCTIRSSHHQHGNRELKKIEISGVAGIYYIFLVVYVLKVKSKVCHHQSAKKEMMRMCSSNCLARLVTRMKRQRKIEGKRD